MKTTCCMTSLLKALLALLGLTYVVCCQHKLIDVHAEQPEGYLAFPNSKVWAFLSQLLQQCTTNNSKDPLGAVKSARKALQRLRAYKAGIPDSMQGRRTRQQDSRPSQPPIVGVTSCVERAIAEAHDCLVLSGTANIVSLLSSSAILIGLLH